MRAMEHDLRTGGVRLGVVVPIGGGVMRRVLVAALALMLLTVVVASATAAPGRRDAERQPSARVQAAGSGLITVAGRLTVNGLIPGRGVVVVRDWKGDAKAFLAGDSLELRRGRATRVRRASGVLYVTGSQITVTIIGNDLSFSIAGSGRARFDGDGVYTVDSEPESEWDGEWIRIAPPSSSPQRRSAPQCANCSSSAAPRR
jgi:hypothetical protein